MYNEYLYVSKIIFYADDESCTEYPFKYAYYWSDDDNYYETQKQIANIV